MPVLDPSATGVAFIGLGVMGRSMAMNLLKAGYRMRVYSRTKSKAKDILAAGAEWSDSIGDAIPDVKAVITMVGYPQDVEEIYMDQAGILACARPGTVLIDMTTSEPSLAKRIYAEARRRELDSLDAPVSGGDVGARNAALSIMVGGDRHVFEQALPLFSAIGKTIVYQGPAGGGQHTKMCNQITIASNMIGIMEALIYAYKAGLQPETVLQSIGAGAAASWSLTNLLPRVMKGDYQPGFYVCHFLKDIGIALKEAEAMKLRLPGLRLARDLYEELIQLGGEKLGTQALFKVYDRGK
jgi:3-hydroxyisobutyrate dehydrogenase